MVEKIFFGQQPSPDRGGGWMYREGDYIAFEFNTVEDGNLTGMYSGRFRVEDYIRALHELKSKQRAVVNQDSNGITLSRDNDGKITVTLTSIGHHAGASIMNTCTLEQLTIT